MRNAFADEITNISKEDSRVVVLSGDIGNRLFDNFKDVSNGRFFNCGIAEANMMGVAAGMALTGYRPVVYTITPFVTARCFEQIRVDVCYHEAPVIIVGTGSGLSYANLGATHHSLEDIAILRTLPGMKIFCPCDATEMRKGLRAALKQNNPLYMRIGKKGEPDLTGEFDEFVIGQANTLRLGNDVCLIGSGTIMPVIMEAAEKLNEQGISARIVNMHTVKPLDTKTLSELASQYELIAIIEEHGRIGGLYGAISEWLASQRVRPPHILSFGTDDEFMHEIGSQNFARNIFGLTSDNIAQSVSTTFKS